MSSTSLYGEAIRLGPVWDSSQQLRLLLQITVANCFLLFPTVAATENGSGSSLLCLVSEGAARSWVLAAPCGSKQYRTLVKVTELEPRGAQPNTPSNCIICLEVTHLVV